MLPDGSIHAGGLWKRFHADRTRRLLRDRFSEMGRRTEKADRWRWVLRDIDLDIAPGDSVGLIGANGSGKSTLLKIFTQVMYPYCGTLDVVGRVGALLEVRAGLHPDLTGRENIYLYGALIGLSRKEIDARFDDIVDFSNLPDAIDRQLKFYSSGMQIRLGFSVAAFLEPDILLVDEALAVGDAFFQQRCLERMSELLRQGTTLVLVTHDLAAVESVCRRGVWLRDGAIENDGPIRDVLSDYRTWVEDYYQTSTEAASDVSGSGRELRVVKAEVTSERGGTPASQQPLVVDLTFESPVPVKGSLCIGFTEGTATPVFISTSDVTLKAGSTGIRCALPYLPLPSGRFYLWLELATEDRDMHLPWQPVSAFPVEGDELTPAPIGVMRVAPVQVAADWTRPGPTDPPDPSPAPVEPGG